ncbi:MAG: diguanylate cyclase, partial [Chloroflexi bacterium]|nr:diguanylate cyclase [Chloroflexota bacterium]
MKRTGDALSELYGLALQEYLGEGGEAALHRAYEVGRGSLSNGLGVLEMAAVHQEALATVLLRTSMPEESARLVNQAADFFMETLSPFEMAQRGFQEANTLLRRLNETLGTQIVAR